MTILLTILTILVVISLVIDLTQTLKTKTMPELHEINPILGPHPSDLKIYVYFAAVTVFFVAVEYFLPSSLNYLRVLWALGWGGVEAWAIRNNLKLHMGW